MASQKSSVVRPGIFFAVLSPESHRSALPEVCPVAAGAAADFRRLSFLKKSTKIESPQTVRCFT